MTTTRSRTHKQVEFAVEDLSGHERILKTFDQAAGFAVTMAVSGKPKVTIDVLIYGVSGARWWGGDDAVARYREDPDASVSDRIEIKANHVGRVY